MTIFERGVHADALPSSVTGATKKVLLAVVVQGAITILHFLYGVRVYEDRGRLHIVVPALVALAMVVALAVLFVRRPGALTLALLLTVSFVPFVAVFGLVHGGYHHVLKLILFHAGASKETLESLFMSPDYVLPDDLVFEVSGVLGLVAAAFVGHRMIRLFREFRRAPCTGSPPETAGAPPESRPPHARSQGGGG